ncbi:cobalt/nickel transport system permease protein [Anoxybacillus vitaminiphilus]|uniref:Cobalt/nickel transport system permease protein n=1 Tax=Paranoxybacillus vitaminiphilus TaxID=581036 RepID=A0A327YGE5_9BACL|nr:cobalt ECF transporter T component CbiQ [Anoxybacillus vitaminiphilus]RAK19547.1 cobalt/nickel transport system permease protein [Anoxybacillus vitaminiphilus]
MIKQFDAVAYNNRLRKVPPEQKVFFAFVLLFIVMFGNREIQAAIIVWLLVWIVGYARVSWRMYAKAAFAASVFLFASLPLLIVSVDRSFHIFLNKAAVDLALDLFFRSFAAWSCLFFLLLTTPFTELLYMFKRIKVPLIIIELLFLVYRFVFVFAQAAEELWIAMKARNGGNHWRQGGMLIFQLVQKIWFHYEALSLALRARNFSGEVAYLQRYDYAVCNRYLIEAIVGVSALLLFGWIGGDR